ncbi:E3 ubiquitin-protein ligase RAD18-like [Lytechinus variegatus]|uniref:E3 ubiquitin-protein ligase RAD18-like n=1 Tax=Lytechinus variegatus TaxID=7654 RepID=UPI001BB19914|nr:E3 ubiquitin-protein ligase RAD18-like [Lytechinus variegatus]
MEFFTITDPSDWPSSMPELKTIDTLLRCGICYEFFDIAMILPKCSHNYCSICIRRYMNYKNQCPTCNTPAEASQLCANRSLDQLVANFKVVRPLILKLCKEEAKKTGKNILLSPQSEPAGGKKKPTPGTLRSPPREQNVGKKTKKSSPFLKESSNDSDSDFTAVEPKKCLVWKHKKEYTGELMILCFLRRSNYQNTRDKISSHASDLGSSSAASPQKTASSIEEDLLMEPGGSTETSSSTLNKSNEENIDPTYQVPNDGDLSDEDVFAVVTPSKPSTSRGLTSVHVGSAAEKNETPITRSEKVECPVCGVPISSKHINVHLDSCLTKSEEKEAKRRMPKRKPLPKIVSSLLSDKEMRKKLREYGLSSQGNRQILNKRLLEYTLMYNAHCDAANPLPVETIVREFNKIDKLKGQPNPTHAEQRLKVKRSLPEDEIAKAQKEYLKSHGAQFNDLIKNIRDRNQNSKKSGKAEAEEGPKLPSVTKIPPATKDDAMPGTSSTDSGHEVVEKNNDGAARTPPNPEEPLSTGRIDVKSTGPSDQLCSLDNSDVPPMDSHASTENIDVTERQEGAKLSRLKSKKSKYFTESTKDIDGTDSRISSPEVELLVEDREESAIKKCTVERTEMAGNSEEQMDVTEDEISPVFGHCSIGSSSGKAQSSSSVKKSDNDGTEMLDKQQGDVLPSSVPPPPNTLLLNDIDTISEGSSLVTLESFSESGSHGDVPSPGDINCIPESPDAVQEKKNKRTIRRKRKPEVNPDDVLETGKETRLTRSRKRGKTSAY